MIVAAVLVAAGSGSRLAAGVPKAFVEVSERTLLEHAAVVEACDRRGRLFLAVSRGFRVSGRCRTAARPVQSGAVGRF